MHVLDYSYFKYKFILDGLYNIRPCIFSWVQISYLHYDYFQDYILIT